MVMRLSLVVDGMVRGSRVAGLFGHFVRQAASGLGVVFFGWVGWHIGGWEGSG